jgi:hypothetical protein
LKVKYKKEALFCLGVAAVMSAKNNNKLKGKRLLPFVYTNKVILSIKYRKKKELQESNCIKKLEFLGGF